MNQLRSSKCEFLKKTGYTLVSYRSPDVKGDFTMGENSIVMDEATIQPRVKIGNNVFVWGDAMIGHHSVIEDNCWLTSGCMVGGATRIGNGSFVGLGAMVGHGVTVGEKCMLGAGSLAIKDLPAGTVTIAPHTEAHRLNSDQFVRMSTCFRL
jgi:UDP-3-O-[3-hydroxymyristoyl] glucosamine N-acyltransferase